jgi:hypothetical protein
MLATISSLLVFAAEGVPPESAMAKLAAPVGALIFVGSIYLLLRANLGTKRGYLVLGASGFGFLFLLSIFWAFGAPGTPQATGPTNLPGQPANELQPRWIAFASDSLLADERAELQVVRTFPEGFDVREDWPEDLADRIDAGQTEIQNFFSGEDAGEPVRDTWLPVETGYVQLDDGTEILGVTYQETDNTLELVPDGATYTGFAFWEPGNPLLPALLLAGISLILFLLHAFLLDRDELRMKRELVVVAEEPAEPVPADA